MLNKIVAFLKNIGALKRIVAYLKKIMVYPKKNNDIS